ncbi:putative transposase [Loktanella atrilutea]|uniref:Putative transposase n=2 Tax=Loktanella atrilutea TaxID=366533 RepID=A0A1M5BQP3_LOKAT|nr:putative transposase [Loktanella atrilutea]
MMQTYPSPTPAPRSMFFTVRLRDEGADLLVRHVEILRLAVRLCQFRYPFAIDDAVILPNRLHMIWSLPPDDQDYTKRWKAIKATFAQHLPPDATHGGPQGSIWQRRFWEQPIETREALKECREMIRMAPVQAGLVDDPSVWPYSRDARLTAQFRRPSGAPVLRLVKD